MKPRASTRAGTTRREGLDFPVELFALPVEGAVRGGDLGHTPGRAGPVPVEIGQRQAGARQIGRDLAGEGVEPLRMARNADRLAVGGEFGEAQGLALGGVGQFRRLDLPAPGLDPRRDGVDLAAQCPGPLQRGQQRLACDLEGVDQARERGHRLGIEPRRDMSADRRVAMGGEEVRVETSIGGVGAVQRLDGGCRCLLGIAQPRTGRGACRRCLRLGLSGGGDGRILLGTLGLQCRRHPPEPILILVPGMRVIGGAADRAGLILDQQAAQMGGLLRDGLLGELRQRGDGLSQLDRAGLPGGGLFAGRPRGF